MTDYGSEGSDPTTRLAWTDEESIARSAEWSRDDPPDGLVTLRFLWNAVRRQVRLWFAIALVGLAAGALLPVVRPAPSLASTQLLLTHETGSNPAEAIATDASLVTTRTVAGRVIDQLGLKQTPDELLEQYSTSTSTDRVLAISASAPTDARARSLARTIASTFLEFRMEQTRAQQEPIKKDIHHAKARVDRLRAKVPIAQLLDDTGSTTDNSPAAKLDRAESELTSLRQTLEEMRRDASLMSSSRVLDPAAIVPHSFHKTLAKDALTGLAAGIVLGIGFVIVSAVLSDRVRTRRDIARALGARVTLSLAGQDGRWWRRLLRPLLGYSRLTERDKKAAASHLYARIPWSEPKPTLAVVSVDSIESTASITASLAAAVADDGYRMLLVDLTGALATRLGVPEPGTQEASVGIDGSTVVVHRPEAHAGAPEGPLLESKGDDTLLAEWADADVVVTLADLPPALGGDHLRTWAADASMVVTAGRSTATKIHSVAEMVRTADLSLDPVIVLGSDKTDETIGLPTARTAPPTYSEDLEVVGQ